MRCSAAKSKGEWQLQSISTTNTPRLTIKSIAVAGRRRQAQSIREHEKKGAAAARTEVRFRERRRPFVGARRDDGARCASSDGTRKEAVQALSDSARRRNGFYSLLWVPRRRPMIVILSGYHGRQWNELSMLGDNAAT